MPSRWSLPGDQALSSRWRLDLTKGRGWTPPGHGTAKDGTQVEMAGGFDPALAPKGFHLLLSPKGTAAPIEHINYTPATGEVHDRGQLAPVNEENYSFLPNSSGAWNPRKAPAVGSGADGGASAYPGTPPLPSMQSGNGSPSQGHTQSADMGGYGTNSPGTGFWFRGFGAGADENGLYPDDPGYDASTEQNPDDPFGEPATPQTPAATAPATQVPATDTGLVGSDVGGPVQGPTPGGIPPGYNGRHGDIEYRNGKQIGYWVSESNPQDPAGAKIDKFIPSPEKPPAAPTAATERWDDPVTHPDGSVTQRNQTTNQTVTRRGPTKGTAATGYPKQWTDRQGRRWQQDSPTDTQAHIVGPTDGGGAPAGAETAANQQWTDTEFRADGSIVQTNPHGEKRVVPGPKQPPQYHVMGNRLIRTDPSNPNDRGQVVYTAPNSLQLQTLADGTIVGVDPETGRSQTIVGDPAKAAQAEATTAQTRASTAQTQESTRSTQMGEIPQVSYAGGNIIVPYGAEADITDYNPLTGQTSSRAPMGTRMTLPDLQRAYGIEPAAPAQQQQPQNQIQTPATPPETHYQDQGVIQAGMAAQQDPSKTTPLEPMPNDQPAPPLEPMPFAQSDIPEGSSRRPPLEDMGAGADDLQKNLRKSIPNWRGSGGKKKTWKGLGKKFYGPGLDDLQPYVGVGAGEDVIDMIPPEAANQPWKPPVDPQNVVGTGHKFGDHLTGGAESTHKGTDLQAVKGTPVKAPVDGTIKVENNPKGLGLSVSVVDAKGVAHKLSHLSKLGPGVKNGQKVKQGQVIGAVGDSGNTTGPHLDIREQKPNGQMVNPERHMPGLTAMPPAPGTEMMTGAGAEGDSLGPEDSQAEGDAAIVQRLSMLGPHETIPQSRAGEWGQSPEWHDQQQGGLRDTSDPRDLQDPILPSGGRNWTGIPGTQSKANQHWIPKPEGMGSAIYKERLNSDVVNDTGGQTDQGGDWVPRSGGWTPPNTGEVAAPKPRIMLPMPGGSGMTDVGGDWAPGQGGGVTASQVPGFNPGDYKPIDPRGVKQSAGWGEFEGGQQKPENLPWYNPKGGMEGPTDEFASNYRPWGGPEDRISLLKTNSLGTGADMPGMGGGSPLGATGGPPTPQMPPSGGGASNPPSPGGGQPDPKVLMLVQALMQLLGGKGGGQGTPQPSGPGGGLNAPPPGLPGQGGPSNPPALPGAGSDESTPLGVFQGRSWGNTGLAGSAWRPRASLNMQGGDIRLGSGADSSPDAWDRTVETDRQQRQKTLRDDPYQASRGMDPSGPYEIYDSGTFGRQTRTRPAKDRWWTRENPDVGAGGMRLANGKWSDALADTPENQKKYGQDSGYKGGFGYQGEIHNDPSTAGGSGKPSGGGGGGGGGGTQVAISPADQARIQLDTQIAQWTHERDSAQVTQAQQNENDRHSEAVRQLEQQAQQEADWKSVQEALQAENTRHNQVQEQLTAKQQELDKTLETMREQSAMALQTGQQQFQSGEAAKTNAMNVMNSALNAPWLQGLLKLGVNPGNNAGAGIPGAQNPWQNLLNVIFGGGNQNMNPMAAQTSGQSGGSTGPGVPTGADWSRMSPAQKAALQASVMAEGPGAWQNFQTQFQNTQGNQAPDQTQLQAAIATPMDTLGTQMTADMFGEGPTSYGARQQQQWNKSRAPNVQQTMLSGTGYG